MLPESCDKAVPTKTVSPALRSTQCLLKLQMIVILPIDITQTFKVVMSLSLNLKRKSTPYVQVEQMHYLCFPAAHLSRRQSITPSLTMEISHCTFLLVSALLHYSSSLTRPKPLPISPVQPFLRCRHMGSCLHPFWDLTLVSSGSLHFEHIISLCRGSFYKMTPSSSVAFCCLHIKSHPKALMIGFLPTSR